MATLIVEDGSGLPNANSFVSLAFADAYHEERGNTAWTSVANSPDDRKTEALIRGFDYINTSYTGQWPGTKLKGRAQSAQWPRKGAVDESGEPIEEDEVPIEVKQAQCEAALRELQEPGSLSPDVVGTARILREKVGDLEVQYADATSASASIPVITTIDNILASLFGPRRKSGSYFFARA